VFSIRGSAVGIANGYGLDDRGAGVRVPVGSRMFTSPYHPDRLWSPPNPLFDGYGGLSPGVKRQGPEADRPRSACAEVNKVFAQEQLFLYLYKMCLINANN
jgi:hypothetical protein